jgi:peptidoglycan/LPS O-acetylase OafA/YrhL
MVNIDHDEGTSGLFLDSGLTQIISCVNTPLNRSRNGDQHRILALDGIRGVAALMVLLSNLRFSVEDPTSHIPDVARRVPAFVGLGIQNYGHLGAAVFFVLSGFVTAQAISGYRHSGRFWLRFCGRRLVRLTPPYYVAIALAIGVALLSTAVNRRGFAVADTPLTAGRVMANLIYAQEAVQLPAISPVFWTLCFEVTFYVVFVGLNSLAYAITRFTGRNGYRLTFVPAGAVALVFSIGHNQADFGAFRWLGAFSTFLLGAVVYHASRARLRLRTALGLVALYGAGGIVSEAPFKIVAVVAAVLIGLAANGFGMERWLKGRVLQFVGRVSYSLYLTQALVFRACHFVVTEFLGTGFSAQLVFVAVAVATSMVVAWALWTLVEYRASLWAHRIQLGRRGHRGTRLAPPRLSVAERVSMLVDR